MSRKPTAYERRSFALLDEFAEAAKIHGWTEDQGTGKSVDNAKTSFDESFNALRKRLIELHRLRRRLEKAQRYIRENP